MRINPQADFRLDIAVLESGLELSQGTPACDLSPFQADKLRAAVKAYDGDLLESWPQEWCLYERERLLLMYLQLLDKLMGRCEAHAAYDEALEYRAQILRADNARERTHRNMMRLHYLAGDRAEALRQYERCRQALREELDVEPSTRTQALYEEILADRLGVVPDSARLADVATSIAALQWVLEGFDRHIRAALDRLERLSSSRGDLK